MLPHSNHSLFSESAAFSGNTFSFSLVVGSLEKLLIDCCLFQAGLPLSLLTMSTANK